MQPSGIGRKSLVGLLVMETKFDRSYSVLAPTRQGALPRWLLEIAPHRRTNNGWSWGSYCYGRVFCFESWQPIFVSQEAKPSEPVHCVQEPCVLYAKFYDNPNLPSDVVQVG
jgi:hypothetical protein